MFSFHHRFPGEKCNLTKIQFSFLLALKINFYRFHVFIVLGNLIGLALCCCLRSCVEDGLIFMEAFQGLHFKPPTRMRDCSESGKHKMKSKFTHDSIYGMGNLLTLTMDEK